MVAILKLKNQKEEVKLDFIHNIYEANGDLIFERKKGSNFVFGIKNIEKVELKDFEKYFPLKIR